MRIVFVGIVLLSACAGQPPAQQPKPPAGRLGEESVPDTRSTAQAEQATQQNRTNLNLLGQTNTAGGEARRNENVQINLVDTNAARELNRRVDYREEADGMIYEMYIW